MAPYAYQQGRRMSVTRSNGTVTSYAYDGASRLTQLTQDLGGGTAHDLDLTFAYNPASQIRENVRSNDVYAFTGLGSGTTASSVNGLNQLTEVGGTALTHDARGNMTSDGTRTFGYSSENLMTSGGGYGFAYDPLMRLSQLEGNGTDRRFLYDPGSGAGSEALVAEYDGNGNLLRRFVHGPGVDEPLVWYEGSGTSDRRFTHQDERGSVVALSNFWGDGLAYAVNRYDEYGVPDTNNVGRFGYTGQVWLPELGMYHYKARFYSPTLGRFMQRDRIGYEGGINLYAYVGNDPLNHVDPEGEEAGSIHGPTMGGMLSPPASQEEQEWRATGFNIAVSMVPIGGGVVWGGRAFMAWRTISSLERSIAAGGRLVLYSTRQVPTLRRAGDFIINMRLGWTLRTNDRIIQAAIRQGRPIRDSFVDRAGNLRPAQPGTVLRRERDQLERAGWRFDRRTQEWKPWNICTGHRAPTTNPC